MNALFDLYPNIGLNEQKFQVFLSTYWIKTKTRKKFFDEFAKERNFDPLNPENWYKIQLRDFQTKKHAGSVLRFYKGNLKKALLHVYPDIGLKADHFSQSPSKDWAEQLKRKTFFENFAKSNAFDPLVLENWNSRIDKLAASKGAAEVLLYYKGSILRALADNYPQHFRCTNAEKRGHWENAENRKQFFENFANDFEFNSNDANMWYKIAARDLWSRKGLSSVLMYHDGNYKKALVDLYPNLNLQIANFN